jgi:hypothetical protein
MSNYVTSQKTIELTFDSDIEVITAQRIDGVECEHLAFRNADTDTDTDTDWQLWVEVGDKPVPRQMVITSKTLNSAPQYTLRVKGWRTGVEPAPDAFAFTPPAGAQELSPNNLVDLDELPQGAPPGEDK